MYDTVESLSLNEIDEVARQADFLCNVIKSHSQTLREARLGRKVYLDGVFFKLFQKDRNTIYQIKFAESPSEREGYPKGDMQQSGVSKMKRLFRQISRTKDISYWFLKMPRLRNTEMVKREIIGAKVVRKVLESHPGYYHMSAIRASVDDAFVLYTKIPGKPLNRALYRSCFMTSYKGSTIQSSDIPTLLSKTFKYFGNIIACCHNYKVSEMESLSNQPRQIAGLKRKENKASKVCIPPASRYPAVSLRKAIDKITTSDTISRSIEQWFGQQHEKKVKPGFVHGNLRLDNVLVSDNKICLIDFENCGYGSFYADLSWTCCLILLTRTLPLFPWKRAQFALNSFLDGYKNIATYDHEILKQFVTMLMCYHYIDAFCLGNMRAKWIAGIPVIKSRFQNLLMAMLRGKIDPISEGVNF